MAESLCSPFPECAPLDGRLLINRTIEGPPLAVDLAEIPFGPVTMAGASAHPSSLGLMSRPGSRAKRAAGSCGRCLASHRLKRFPWRLGIAPKWTMNLWYNTRQCPQTSEHNWTESDSRTMWWRKADHL